MARVASPKLEILLLGAPVLRRTGYPLHFDTRKALALVALLASDGEQLRDRLAAMLWPDSDRARARGALRRTLSVTRAAMGDCIRADGLAVRLDPSLVEIDLREFRSLADAGDRGSLERAALLCRGPFLAGFGLRDSPDFDDWQAVVAEEVRARLAEVLAELVGITRDLGEFGRAVGWGRRWLDLDPLNEPAHRVLIELHAAAGQRAAALQQYRECVQILDRELGVAPLPETTAAYERVLTAAGPAGAAAGATAEREPGPSPHPPLAPSSREVPETRFVGRAAELAALWAAWESGRSGGQVVALTGEPGSGKTSLLDQFADQLQALGAPLLRVRCHEGEEGIPFAAIADLLGAAVRPALLEKLPAHLAQEVARLRPEFGGDRHGEGPSPADTGPASRARLLGAVAEVLRLALGTDPASGSTGALVVDDLHFADAHSVEAIAYLLNRLDRRPLLVVLAWAPSDSPAMRVIEASISKCQAVGSGRKLVLSPFTLAEIREVLGEKEGADGGEAHRILDQTRGLPMMVREYARVAAEVGPDFSANASIPEVMRAWIRSLPEPAKQVISAAAVLASEFDFELLRAVSGRTDSEVDQGVTLGIERGLLTQLERRDHRAATYDFAQEGLREVAESLTATARQRLLHRRAAEALAKRYERDPSTTAPGAVALQWQSAGRDADASRWWWRAAERARALGAGEEALQRIGQALASGYPRLPALIEAGDLLTALGRYREALAAYEAAAAEASPSELILAEVERKLADVYARRGDLQLAEIHLETGLELVPRSDPAGRARLGAELALVADRAGHRRRAGAARAALAQARRTADPAVRAKALNALGVLAGRDQRLDDAEALLREALLLALEARDGDAEVAALNNLGRVLAEQGRLDEALEQANQALSAGVRGGDRHRIGALHTNLADILHARGQNVAAQEQVRESAASLTQVDSGEEREPAIWMLTEW